MPAPSYLHLHDSGIYYFRIAVPRRLQPILKVREIRRTLKTSNYKLAIKLARTLAVFVESLFLSEIPSKQEFFSSLKQGVRSLTRESTGIREALVGSHNYRPDTQQNRAEKTVTLTTSVPVLPMSQEVNPGSQTQPVELQPYSMRLSELIEKYVQCQMDENSWQPKTKDENIAIFDILLRVVEDIPLSNLDHGTTDSFRSILKKLPRHINKNPVWQGLTIKQIIDTKPTDTLSNASVNKYMRRISSMFNWAVEREYAGKNYFRKKPIKELKKANEKRDMLTSDDLAAIFHLARFEAEADQPFKYWTPLIALYTGARQNEIASLNGSDVKKIHGIWCFRFITAKQKQYAERIVPIHSRLQELGIIEYAERQAGKLFPELDYTRDGYGQAVSKWYNRYRRKCGLDDIRNKDFHSFRHTLSTALYRAGVESMLISEIDGHVNGGGKRRTTTEEVYIKPSEVATLRDVIEKLDYGDPLRLVRAYVELFQ